MGANTNNLEDYTVFSSVSLAGSGATLKALDIVASTFSGTGTNKYAVVSASTLSGTVATAQAGTAVAPGYAFLSEVSLGLYRSTTSQVALSYGTFNATGLVFKTLGGSAFTIASSATTRTILDTQFYFSVTSTTSAELGFRSGQTIYKFANLTAG